MLSDPRIPASLFSDFSYFSTLCSPLVVSTTHLVIVNLDIGLCGSLDGHGEFLRVAVLGAHREVGRLTDHTALQWQGLNG